MLALSSELPLFLRSWKETALKHTRVVSRNTNLIRFWFVLWVLRFMTTHGKEDSRTHRARWDQEMLCSGLVSSSSLLAWYP